MSVREFDGVDDQITLGPGSLGTICNGAYSLVMVIKPTSLTSETTFGIEHSGGLLHLFLIRNTGGLRMVNDVDDCDIGTMNVDTSWQILGMSKASGTVPVTMHRKALGSGSWTHTASAANGTNRTQTVSVVRIGGADGTFQAARIGTVALFNTQLADADFESIQTTPSTQKLDDLGAVALWDLNQASAATDVEDLVGTADETAIVGTTVIEGDDPTGWTFGLTAVGNLAWVRA